jgi:cytochrome c peroxidase
MTAAKVALGRHLFYDTRLSGNGQQSCASCHEQAKAFTDGRARSLGLTDNPNKTPSIKGFTLTASQRADLVAFLNSLTDEAVLRDPPFANPWPATRQSPR